MLPRALALSAHLVYLHTFRFPFERHRAIRWSLCHQRDNSLLRGLRSYFYSKRHGRVPRRLMASAVVHWRRPGYKIPDKLLSPSRSITENLRHFATEWPTILFVRPRLQPMTSTVLHLLTLVKSFTIVANIIMMIMMHSRTGAQSTNYSYLMPFVVVRNSMACKVYRDVKLGLLMDDVPTRCSRWSADLRFAANPNSGLDLVNGSKLYLA